MSKKDLDKDCLPREASLLSKLLFKLLYMIIQFLFYTAFHDAIRLLENKTSNVRY